MLKKLNRIIHRNLNNFFMFIIRNVKIVHVKRAMFKFNLYESVKAFVINVEIVEVKWP